MNLPRQQLEQIVLGGGYDQVTPTLSLGPGFFRRGFNFECSINGGYTRIAGYERYDGSAVPSEADYQILYVNLTEPVEQGYTVTGVSSGATATVVDVLTVDTGVALMVTNVNGDFDYEGEELVIMAPTPTPGGDPYWDNVWSLVHFEEYSDEGAGELKCEKGKTPVAYNDSTLTELAGLFGKGLAIESSTNSRLEYTEELLAADAAICTIELAFSVTEVESYHFGFLYLQGAGRVQINITDGALAAGFTGPQISSSHLIQADTMYRVALVNDGTTVYLFLDGVLQGTAADPGTTPPAPNTEAIEIGGLDSTGYPGFIHVDEFRLTLGVARYTSDYIVAETPFPDFGAAS